MFITNQYITFADAVSEDGTDYGTGYYRTNEYSNGSRDFVGPYNYEEEERRVVHHTTRIF